MSDQDYCVVQKGDQWWAYSGTPSKDWRLVDFADGVVELQRGKSTATHIIPNPDRVGLVKVGENGRSSHIEWIHGPTTT